MGPHELRGASLVSSASPDKAWGPNSSLPALRTVSRAVRYLTMQGVALIAAGATLALAVGYMLVHGRTSVAIALAFTPLLAVWLVPRPSRGLALGLVLILAVPSWWQLGGRHVLQYAALLAAFSALSARRLRLTGADCALAVYVTVVVLGWLLQYDQPHTWHLVLTELTPIGFYLGARAVPQSRLRRLMALTLFAGTLGALSVIYEFSRGHVLFIDPTLYKWNASLTDIFRPGGIFGGPPGAGEVLCCVLFFGLAALGVLRGRVKVLALACLAICSLALVVTFTRAALIGGVAGLLLFLWLVRSPLLRPARVVLALVAASAALLVVLPSLETNPTFYEGIVRPGTLSAREGYWRLALPVATASPHNLIFGVGTGTLGAQALASRDPLPFDVAVTPQTYTDSLHNQYITTLVEQGLIGVAALVGLLLAGFLPAARAARRGRDVAAAAIAASILSTAIVFAQDSNLDHPPSVVMLLTTIGLAAGAASRNRGKQEPDPRRALPRV